MIVPQVVLPHPPQGSQRNIVADATGVMNEVTQGRRMLISRNFWHILLQLIVQGELPLVGEKENTHGDELLLHGGNVEDRCWGDGDVVVQICHAVAT